MDLFEDLSEIFKPYTPEKKEILWNTFISEETKRNLVSEVIENQLSQS